MLYLPHIAQLEHLAIANQYLLAYFGMVRLRQIEGISPPNQRIVWHLEQDIISHLLKFPGGLPLLTKNRHDLQVFVTT